jgi:phosphoribosylglycinamide formyltransferase-1
VRALRAVARALGSRTGVTPRVAVLVSGGGTTLENFATRIADGRLDAEIVHVIASKPGIGAIDRCARLGLDVTVVPWRGAEQASAFSGRITRAVDDAGADLVCMAGFLRLWEFPPRWFGRALNIHPGLLPRFGGRGMYGHHVHEAVLAAGVTTSLFLLSFMLLHATSLFPVFLSPLLQKTLLLLIVLF